MACTSRLTPALRTLVLFLIALGFATTASAQSKKPRKKTAAHAASKKTAAHSGSASGRNRNRITRTKPRSRIARPASAHALKPGTAFGLDGLRADLGMLAETSIHSGSWGMMVVSLSHGDTLFSINADVPHLPASTQKVLTSVLALNTLGPQYRYHTDVLRTGTLSNGRLDGDLILRGDGDPSMSSRFIGGKPDAAMDSLAARVLKAGVRDVTGRVIGDATAFEARSIPEGWHKRILQDAYAGRVSGLSLNENIVWVTIRPTAKGNAADVVLEPATTSIPLHSSVRTVAGRGASIHLAKGSAGITVTGSIGADVYQRSYSYIVEDPASFTTGAFLAALQRNGITVSNGMTLAKTPVNAVPLTTWESAPLETLLTVMNRESVNVIAEHVFRAASRGADRHAVGAATTGDSALRALLGKSAGVRTDAVSASDGSGLSQLDKVSPRAMVQLLGWADKSAWGPLLHASLPLAGESGTLRHRMIGSAAQTNLHAKTGTTNDVVALAGYVTARDGELIAFAMLYNGRDRWRAREAIDAIGVTLANWSR